jgi:adenosylhomocysteine nucleosidase
VATHVVVFAIAREAAPFARSVRPGVRVVVSGMGAVRAAAAIEALGPEVGRVTCAGFGGALDPALRIGDIVAADRPNAAILTVPAIVAPPADKLQLFRTTGARIADMESAGAFAACRRRIPCTAVRAVSDTADEALPPDLAALLDGGNVSAWAAAKLLFRRPSALRDFRRLARNTTIAARALARYLEAAT